MNTTPVVHHVNGAWDAVYVLLAIVLFTIVVEILGSKRRTRRIVVGAKRVL